MAKVPAPARRGGGVSRRVPATRLTGTRGAHTSSTRRTAAVPGAARAGQIVLTPLFLLVALFAVSTMFVEDLFAPEASVLIASFGTLASGLGLAAVSGGTTSRTVRSALWLLPLFFVWHVAALGTWLPDAPLVLISAAGAALGAGRR